MDMNGVLAVNEKDRFFKDDAADFVAPDGQAHVEAELLEVARAVQFQGVLAHSAPPSGRESRREGGSVR